MVEITIIGAGGIGSNLTTSIASAISRGDLVSSLGGVKLFLMDSDTVEDRNLMMGQRFSKDDIGRHKVDCIRGGISEFESELLEVIPISNDVRERSDIPGSDIVVVCVDNMEARRVVHGMDCLWLDLRCSGDGYIAIDYRVNEDIIASLSQEQNLSGSCQLEGWESGFLQAGYLAASAHGFQWIIAALRKIAGCRSSILPSPRSSSVTFGKLGELPVSEVIEVE